MGTDESNEVPAPLHGAGAAESLLAPPMQYIAEVAQDGTILAVNGISGAYSIEEVVGTKIQRWVAPVAKPELERALTEAFAADASRSFVWIGAETGRRFASCITPVRSGSGIAHAVVTTHEVTEREREQQALRESEQRFHALVHGAFEGLAITVDGVIVVANEALGRMLGVSAESLVGRIGYEFCIPEERYISRNAVRRGDETPYEITGLRPDGSRFPCENIGRNIMYLGKTARLTGFRDLTERHRLDRERKEIEEQMRQAQKLESLGMLAGGIAHDFNNVLMAVLANAQMALASAKTSAETAAHLANVEAAAMRGRELTRQLLNYAAQGPLTSQPVELNELVRDTVALLEVSISKKAELSLHLADESSIVEGDPGQLRQLIMNLLINASDALGDKVGQIAIDIAPVQVTPGDLEGSPLLAEIPSGRAVLLRVRDTGQGMSEETQKRIYDPFFTTKTKGRGLGLASVLNVVRGHRGAIRFTSTPGSGSEFSVWLKRSDDPPARSVTPSGPRSARTSRGLALVVDDEPMLRSAAAETLQVIGFDVIVAQDGEQALQRFAEHSDELALVLLDLTMPKLSGIEALRRLRERSAHLPVLCVSGYSAEFVALEISADPATRFLAKPYSIAEVTEAIDTLLGVSSGASAETPTP
jgi:two-component system cell cycle sensor histidine kinase/response regulator CckA